MTLLIGWLLKQDKRSLISYLSEIRYIMLPVYLILSVIFKDENFTLIFLFFIDVVLGT